MKFLTPIAQTVIGTGIIAIGAWLFKDKITNYIANTRRMKKYGIKSLYADNGRFTTKELNNIFYESNVVKVFYASGYNFWTHIIELGILERIREINPALHIHVILCDSNSPFIQDVCEWERRCEERTSCEMDLDEQIKHTIELLKPYNWIDIKTDTAGYYFLPYLIAEYDDTHEVYWNLTIPPYRSHDSLKVIGERKTSSINSNMVSYFESHFKHVWSKSQIVY